MTNRGSDSTNQQKAKEGDVATLGHAYVSRGGKRGEGRTGGNLQLPDNGGIYAELIWWSLLVVAVLVVPSLAFIVAFATPVPDPGKLVVFVLACWLITYLGLRYMASHVLRSGRK